MRGDNDEYKRPIVIAATIVDERGKPVYQIVPNKVLTTVALCVVVLVIVVVILTSLVYVNRNDIEKLRKEVKEVNTPEGQKK